jgi:hypothetical protein
MDPIVAATIAREALKTALEIRAIYTNNSQEDAELLFLDYLADIKTNQSRTYESYDPNLKMDLAAQGG